MTSTVPRAGKSWPGAAVQVGSRLERGVELDDRAADLPRLEAVLEGGGDVVVAEQAQRDLGVGVADDGGGADQRPVLEPDALVGHDLGDGDAGGEHGAGLLRGVGDRERDHPHAAADVAPQRAAALEVALVVHELDARGALVLRARPGADHALAEERVLEPLVAHVVVEHLGDRGVEDDVDHRLLAVQELLELGAARRVAEPAVALAGAQAPADLVEEVLVGPVALLVLLGDAERVEVGLGAGVVDPLAEGACRPRTGPTGWGRRCGRGGRAA